MRHLALFWNFNHTGKFSRGTLKSCLIIALTYFAIYYTMLHFFSKDMAMYTGLLFLFVVLIGYIEAMNAAREHIALTLISSGAKVILSFLKESDTDLLEDSEKNSDIVTSCNSILNIMRKDLKSVPTNSFYYESAEKSIKGLQRQVDRIESELKQMR